MKREKEAKAKQTISTIASRINRSSSPHRHEESNACVYSTTTYNAIDKNVLKKLKESQASKGNSSSTAENTSATKQDKKTREKLRRKLERKGLSKNAIKSQLRPCLTWNEDIEERLGRKGNTRRQVPVRIHDIRKTKTTATNSNSELKESDTPKSPSKTKVCKLCGKKILGDILDHFSKEHFSFYVANKEIIMSHPGAFTVDEDKYDSKIHLARNVDVAKPHKNHTQNNKQTSETQLKKAHMFNHKKMREIISDLEEHPEEQTYRGWDLFMCDGCEKTCKHGRVIFVNMNRRLHLCYDCYKHAKSIVKFKRGNKHVYINTPM
jgi:SOS response regulatory protein OraA/RecX